MSAKEVDKTPFFHINFEPRQHELAFIWVATSKCITTKYNSYHYFQKQHVSTRNKYRIEDQQCPSTNIKLWGTIKKLSKKYEASLSSQDHSLLSNQFEQVLERAWGILQSIWWQKSQKQQQPNHNKGIHRPKIASLYNRYIRSRTGGCWKFTQRAPWAYFQC